MQLHHHGSGRSWVGCKIDLAHLFLHIKFFFHKENVFWCFIILTEYFTLFVPSKELHKCCNFVSCLWLHLYSSSVYPEARCWWVFLQGEIFLLFSCCNFGYWKLITSVLLAVTLYVRTDTIFLWFLICNIWLKNDACVGLRCALQIPPTLPIHACYIGHSKVLLGVNVCVCLSTLSIWGSFLDLVL